MIKRVVFVPLLVIALMALSTRFGVPGTFLAIAPLFVYLTIGLCGNLTLRRVFKWPKRANAFSLPVLILEFLGMSLLAASSSFSSATLNGISYKPPGVVDFAGVLTIAAISTGAVAISMIIVDASFFGISKLGGRPHG